MRRIIRQAAAICAVSIFAITSVGCTSKREEIQKQEKEAGIEALSQGDYDTAITQLKKALKETDSSVGTEEYDISYYLAAAQYCNGAFDDAINTYTSMMDMKSDDSGPVFLRGSIYADEDELEHADADYREAISRNPEDYELYIRIYEHLNGLGHTEEGLKYLKRALNNDSSSSKDYLGRGRIYLLLGQYNAAEVALNNALKGGDKTAYAYLCRLYDARSNAERADQYLRDYKKQSGLKASDFVQIASLEMDRSDYDTALADIATGLKRSGSDTASEQSLRQYEIACLEHQAKYQEAYDKVKEYIKDYPSDLDMPKEETFLKGLLTNAVDSSGSSSSGTSETSSEASSTSSSSGRISTSGT